MGDLYDAAPPWMQEAMQQHDEFRQALSAVEGEGGKLGDLIEYAVLFRAVPRTGEHGSQQHALAAGAAASDG
ncbi:hypothetical protein [Candidatus Palauibacter sp.]|uniref:hypothetical protein n=1 Tax=Candidatus Palauibacter sp. TaxID=3101350 RepID=UPI003B51CA5D